MSAVLITLHDVEPAVRLNAALEQEGFKTEVVSPLDDIRSAVVRAKPELMVVTGALTDPHVEAIVREQLWGGAAAIGLADVSEAAQLEKIRAAGYVELHTKPIETAELVAVVKRLIERRKLQNETGLIGESEPLREVLVKIEQMAPVSSTVLIEGESGTGKELVARALHRLSARKNKPFIGVSVGALSDTLLESELFGHEKGAFTGAAERRIGLFELADTGTLFLDEIGEIPMGTQVKLLRVLEEREFLRVGGTQPIHVDVRVIAATNRSLRSHVEEGSFRSDLFYRLNVLYVYLPPLRERPRDVPHLVRKFIDDYSREHDRAFHGVSAEAMQLLMDYPWPGNVRELRNLIESMVVLAPGREIQPDDLPRQIREGGSARWLPVPMPGAAAQATATREGRELEFILRSLLDLRLQVEDLKRQVGGNGAEWTGGGGVGVGDGQFIGEVLPAQAGTSGAVRPLVRGMAGAIAPRNQGAPSNAVLVEPGMPMADVERRVIEAALREARGNRRKTATMLGIGERTLYRKIKEYRIPEDGGAAS
ncbi:MAG TPA: sigma-54 dependent transcriptional regulator [Gemmatimonadaceae bacterium]